MNGIIFFMSIVLAVVSGLGFFFPKERPPAEAGVAKPAVATGAAEVSDLIERLKPLAKDPDSRWGGIEVSFSGADVRVKLKTKNENEYHGTAKTLREAVDRITSPSKDISDALVGWTGSK